MSTDKLQSLHNTVAEILSEPPSPPTFFDEEPDDAARAREQIAKASDSLGRATEIPKENVGTQTSRKFGFSPNEISQTHITRDSASESVDIGRSRLSQETTTPPLDRQTASINTVRAADAGDRISLGGWALRGFAGILLAAGIGA